MNFIIRNVFAFLFLVTAVVLLSMGAAHAGGSKAEAVEGAFHYVELAPFMLPIVDDNGVSQVVNLVVALEVLNVESADKVRYLQPKLTDAFIMDMYGMLNYHAATSGGALQVGDIKARLNELSDEVMGDSESVHDVLLQVVQQRPI
jgi:flagellar basal body-associated protein FliL